ncbi:hypothetical protein MHU86_14234 [Fragilaria crotonensis]|nr:hypothetical protein MHU86_14234 [Fragilaria crotonensis]
MTTGSTCAQISQSDLRRIDDGDVSGGQIFHDGHGSCAIFHGYPLSLMESFVTDPLELLCLITLKEDNLGRAEGCCLVHTSAVVDPEHCNQPGKDKVLSVMITIGLRRMSRQSATGEKPPTLMSWLAVNPGMPASGQSDDIVIRQPGAAF